MLDEVAFEPDEPPSESDEPPSESDEPASLPDDVTLAWAALERARAGSCPVTSTTVISSQVATNSATVALTTRRRIVRTRA